MRFGLKQRLLVHILLPIVVTSILPPWPTAFGQTGRPALLPQRVTGINASADVTQDFSLASGFVLSGTIRAPQGSLLIPVSVTVQSENTTFAFSFPLSLLPANYRFVVPAGTYSITPLVLMLDQATTTGISFEFSGLETVSVTGDTTKDLTIPALPQRFLLQGTVTTAGTLPTRTAVSFTSDDGKVISIQPQASSQYRIVVPAGNYTVGVAYTSLNVPSNLKETLVLPVSKTTVSANQTLNIVIPPVFTISGAIKDGAGAGAVPATVNGVNSDVLAGFVTVPGQNTDGKYSLLLPAGMYDLSAAVTLKLNPNEGVLTFPFPASKLELSGDVTRDFVKPTTTAMATISGKVTGPDGKAVANADVTASSSELTEAPNAIFSTTVKTKSDGTYTMKLLAGKNYTLTCTPAP
jgi:hypothetical protein